jgi:hypothetical protein
MGDEESKAALLAEKGSLLLPEGPVSLAKNHEECVVLSERDRELDDAPVEERQPCTASAWLRLERVGVRIRRVILEPEQPDEVPCPLRGGRAETDSVPSLRVTPDLRKALLKRRERLEVPAVVAKAVHADLESPFGEFADRLVVDLVPSGHEVPRRAEAVLLLDLAQAVEVLVPEGRLDVVRHNECPSIPAGPGSDPRNGIPSDPGGDLEKECIELV